MNPKSELGLQEFVVQGPDGSTLPYMGHIEALVYIPGISKPETSVPILVVLSMDYNTKVPVMVGTNVLKFIKTTNE